MHRNVLPLALIFALAAGCATDDTDFVPPDAALDGAGNLCSDPTGDEDQDGIPNGDEGCLTGRDTDGDKIPDWQDSDSDDDGILDSLEKGAKSGDTCATAKAPKNGWPCDHDGDGVPDFMDVDSDGDNLLDKDEDANGDGKVGCCLELCNEPGDIQKEFSFFILEPQGGLGVIRHGHCFRRGRVPSLRSTTGWRHN